MRFISGRSLGWFCAALAVAGGARAIEPAEGEPETAPREADAVVTTADRRARAVGEGVVATEVVDRNRIVTSGAEDVGQALVTTAGVQVDRSFRGAALLLQGLDPQHTLILVDGERLVGARDGALDLSRFNAMGVRQIEIVRGPASALYGSDAMAGVVNLVTRPPEEGFAGEGQGRYGMTFARDPFTLGHNGSGWASAAGGSEDVRGRLSFGYRHASAYDLTPENRATTGAERDDYDALARLSWQPSSRFELPLFARAARRDLYAIDESGSGAVFDRRQRNEDLTVFLKPTWHFRADRQLTLLGSYAVMRSQQLTDQRLDDDGDVYEDAREQLATVRVQSDVALWAPVTLSTGVELLGSDYKSPRLTERGQRGRLSPYGQVEWTIRESAPRIAVSPGVRVDADSQYGVNVSPRFAVRCDPVEALRLRAAVGRGFRAPSFTELLLDFQNGAANYRVSGNQDLEPERSLGASLSAEFEPGDRVKASVNLFRNELRDLIDTQLVSIIAGEQQFQYVNVHRARTQGIESTLLIRPHGLITLEVTYALTHARDLERDRPLQGRALHRGSARAVLGGGLRGWSVSARCQIVGERWFLLEQEAGVEESYTAQPYAMVDARAALRVGDHVEPFLVAENLTNVGDTNLPARPTSAYVGMNVYY